MNWLIVVFFTGVYPDGTQDSYIFEKPSYETKEACVIAANDPDKIRVFVKAIIDDIGYKKVHKVVCSTEKQIKEVLELSKGVDT